MSDFEQRWEIAKGSRTLGSIGQQMGLTKQAIQAWAKRTGSTLLMIARIANLLDVDPAWLAFGSSTTGGDGLHDPHLSCNACHDQDGRHRPCMEAVHVKAEAMTDLPMILDAALARQTQRLELSLTPSSAQWRAMAGISAPTLGTAARRQGRRSDKPDPDSDEAKLAQLRKDLAQFIEQYRDAKVAVPGSTVRSVSLFTPATIINALEQLLERSGR